MKILYVHGYLESGNAKATKLIKAELDKRGIRYTLDAPKFPVGEPRIMNQMLTGLLENREYDCLITSSLGAFYALLPKRCRYRILVNPALPVDYWQVPGNEALSGRFFGQVRGYRNYIFSLADTHSLSADTYFIFGNQDEFANNEEEFMQHFTEENNVFHVDDGHRLGEAGAEKICDIIEIIKERNGNEVTNADEAFTHQWANGTVLDVPVDEFVKQNADKTLAQVLGKAPYAYAYYDIMCLELSVAAYNCYSSNMNPPLCYDPDLCLTVGNLLNITVKQLFEMRNLSRKRFVEIITKADVWLKQIRKDINNSKKRKWR